MLVVLVAASALARVTLYLPWRQESRGSLRNLRVREFLRVDWI
jgi:hypothetical protein